MSTPRINPNDPKWTAYVLGELDAAEAEAVERLLAASAEARALVEDIRLTAMSVEDALASEPPLLLTPAQRAAVRTAADASPSRSFLHLPAFLNLPAAWVWGAGAAAVASAVIAIGLQSPSTPVPATPETVLTSAPESLTLPDSTLASPSEAPGRDRPAPNDDGRGRPSGRPSENDRTGLPSAAADKEKTSRQEALRSDESKLEDAKGARDNVAQSAASPTGTVNGSVTVTGERPVYDAQRQRTLRSAAPVPLPAAPLPSPSRAPEISSTGRAGAVVGGVGGGVFVGGFAGSATSNVDAIGRAIRPPANTESYATVAENGFIRVSQEPLATFSIDVDTASYSNVRRFLTQDQMPPADAVRIEELINYFTYDYPRVSGSHPIGTTMAVAAAPWNPRNRLVRIGVKAREIDPGRRPPSNLVFLIDVSGSMNTPQKLPLVKSGLKLLVDQLGENDTVSIVVYAGASGLVLSPTRGDRKDVIARAIDDLQPGGSTNGAAGIQLAYNEATAGFIRGGTNRVILMTDGDFNVGVTSQGDLTRLIEEKARSGVFLSVFGFGMGNLKDSTLERLADQGNGHYDYIDSLNEARKVLVEQMSGTLVTVAKDVKIQVDFNRAKVEAYRLIGYENRVLRPEDFNNDLKDAGDMGAGHTVTALFEVVPRGGQVPGPSIDPSVFQPAPRDTPPPASTSNDMLVLRVRYKLPDAATSTRMDVPLADRAGAFSSADADFRFATSVAAFGMILKDSPYRGDVTLNWVLDTAMSSRGQDRGGYRGEFVSLVQKAIAIQTRRARD